MTALLSTSSSLTTLTLSPTPRGAYLCRTTRKDLVCLVLPPEYCLLSFLSVLYWPAKQAVIRTLTLCVGWGGMSVGGGVVPL